MMCVSVLLFHVEMWSSISVWCLLLIFWPTNCQQVSRQRRQGKLTKQQSYTVQGLICKISCLKVIVYFITRGKSPAFRFELKPVAGK